MDENNKDDVCPASLFLQIDYNNQFYRIDYICNIYWFMVSKTLDFEHAFQSWRSCIGI